MDQEETTEKKTSHRAVHSVHDKFFRHFMTDIKVAREFLNHHLPKAVRSAVDLSHLTLCSGSYVDKKLALRMSDMLYKTKIAGRVGYIYLLVEHQSTVDIFMPLRIWQYMVNIWFDFLKQAKNANKKLPLIIPLVFYHGRQPYNASCDLKDLMDAPADLVAKVLYQAFTLIDTHNISDEDLRDQQWSGIMTFVMKHIFQREMLNFLEPLIKHMQQFQGENEVDYAIVLLNYLLSAGETKDIDRVVETIREQLTQPSGDKIMATVAEHWRQEGIQQGLQQGMQEGRQEGLQQGMQQGELLLLTRLLERKFGHLPVHYRQRLEKADADRLLDWSERLLEINTLEELFDQY